MIDTHFITGFVFGCHLCPNFSDLGIKGFEKTKDFFSFGDECGKINDVWSGFSFHLCLVVKDSHCFTDKK